MSFSSKVKGEICRYSDISKEEALAEISGIMKDCFYWKRISF